MLVVLVYPSEYLQIDSDTIIVCRSISLPGFNDLCCKVSNWILSWVYDIISHIIYIFNTFFKHEYITFISWTDVDICKRWTAFSIFCEIQCDTSKNSDSRGKN